MSTSLTTPSLTSWSTVTPSYTPAAISLQCTLHGAPWFDPARWCECGPFGARYPTVSSSAPCFYSTLPGVPITPITIAAVPTNVPGLGGKPKCAAVMYPNGQACLNADYCNCGGTPVPFLTTTVSGTTTSNCGYTIQPTTSNCPTPTTTLPPPTTAPPSVTVSCLTNSRSMLSSITPDLISHIMSAFCYLGTVSGPPNPLTIDAAHTFAQLYDGTTDRDGVYLYKPRDHLYVKMAADVPACQTKSLAIYRAGGEDCITSLGSVLAACPTYGGSLQSFDECFEWGVDSKTCLECQSSGLEME